jgi:hypothetical protein
MKKNRLSACLILGLILISSFKLYSQSNKLGVSIPSPNAASLGIYGEMPVSYFTGVPEISIPLYNVSGNKISLPISMNYHAGGIRPDVHPGWIGNGWSLTAGGVITRMQNGQSDERYRPGQGYTGYYYNCSNLNSSDWNSPERMTSGHYYPVQNLALVQVDADTEPDEFNFSFMGYVGKFFLDQTGNWQVQCDKKLKVIFNKRDFVKPFITRIPGGYQTNDVSQTFGVFTIIDENGNKYIFGTKDNNNTSIEFTDVMIPTRLDGFGATINATSWYLSQVISADGTEIINLNYERGPLTSQLGYSSSYGAFNSPGVSTGFSWGIPNSFSSPCTNNVNTASISGWVVFPVYLTSITMPCKNILVDFSATSKSNELKYQDDLSNDDDYTKTLFHYETDANGIITGVSSPVDSYFPSRYVDNAIVMGSYGVVPYYASHYTEINNTPNNSHRFIWLKLDKISIKNTNDNSLNKSISFNYNNNTQQRLQLLSLSINDNNNTPVQNYSFGYNTLQLPKYLKTFTDHWGYHNNTLLSTPFYNTPRQGTSQYRSPDPTGILTQAGILTSINFPTGGKTNFIYEPNQYSKVVYRDPESTWLTGTIPRAESGIGGGLRIKEITSSDGFGYSVKKKYFYVKNFSISTNPTSLTSSGVLDTKPKYAFLNTGTLTNGATISYQIEDSNPVIPVTSNSSGSLIGYSEVVEQRSDGGYSIYKFTNHDNGYNDQLQFASTYALSMTYYPPTSLAFERGKLLYKADYSVNATQEKLVSENIMIYTSVMPTEFGGLSAANALYNRASLVCGSAYEGRRSAYSMHSFPFLPSLQTSKNYSSDGSGNSVTRTSTYQYNYDKNLLSSQRQNSKGQTEVVKFTYPSSLATSDPLNPYSLMINLNNVNKPIERIVTVNDNVISAELYTYKILNGNKVYNDGVYKFESPSPVSINSMATTFYTYGGNLKFDSRYKKVADVNYDDAGNIASIRKKGNNSTSYLWDYNLQMPVAKIMNADNIYSSGNINNPTVQSSLNIGLTNTLNNSIVNTFLVGAPGASSSVNLSFSYNNPYISGNNNTVLTYYLSGPNYYNTGTLCAATNASTCSGVSTLSLLNLPYGTYTLSTYISSVTGFSNYYGYTLNFGYPSQQFAVIIGKSDIAYTSFEYQTTNELSYGTGNFSGVSFTNIQTGSAVTGDKYYLLDPSGLVKDNLDNTKTYVISYWSNSGAYSIPGSLTLSQGNTLNFGNWKYYEHTISSTTSIVINGSGGIDELRIYPKGALMSTYTYKQLVGMTSECDATNNTIYYEYDSFNRLKTIRDKDKNIIKQMEYKY